MTIFQKIVNYFKTSIKELKQVNWPSKKETWRYTWKVISLSLIVALALGVIDFILLKLIALII
ncbi:MAG: preprotein translocase subunit SecE [Parcubacteria group bacterium ADurb.Bin305]|jgi:preprotein translocase SecE subunit|nr:preprotein translocase subunit SecE [Candidatus Paceibacterota bacterium]MDD3434346.1 preprotein translocase subunit SecE [Candidatus Paceibacterota bacterium]OQA44457.1 MAG: preprotein translocase subunit SecE [Parcubacteria group bacterium ADurb.Bin305]